MICYDIICHDMICYVMIFFWPGRGRGPAPAGAGRWPGPGPAPAPGPGRGRAPDKGRDRRAAAQWLSTRTCLPGGWAVEPRTTKKGQMLHETDREWSPQAVKQ